MQHPLAYSQDPGGNFALASFWGLLLNPWALWQYAHNMLGAVQTGCFVMAAVGAFYLLCTNFESDARIFVRAGVIVGVIAAILQLYPTGDMEGVLIARYQPVTLAAMEGLFVSQEGAPLAILGQPDIPNRRLDNPLVIPRALSFLTYRAWTAEVRGLDRFPESDWPDFISLVYYSYHVMVGLGTLFIAIMLAAAFLLARGSLYRSRWMLWILILALPFPYIANTAGWITAEAGRQPWVIYGLMRTSLGISPRVSEGNVWFTLLGFFGMYLVLGILFLFLIYREIDRGPAPSDERPSAAGVAAPRPASQSAKD
jgi:cytochrome d ubiquinol oxidase subunit I